MRARRTCSARRGVGTFGSKSNRNLTCGKIDDARWNKEWRDFTGTTFEKRLMLTFNNCKSPDTRTYEYAGTLCQLRTNRQGCLFHRTLGGGNRVVDEGIHLLDVF